MKSFCFFNFGWKFPPKTWKKQQWLFQSLLLKMSVSYRNRTYNRVLGGPRYIHLTKETNAVFPGFFDPLAPAAIIYNSNTFVMNYLFLISSDFSDFASLSDPQTLPFFFKRVPPWFYLRRRLLYPFNYGNKCRIFGLFQPFRSRRPTLWTQSLSWWIIWFLISTFLYAIVQIELFVTTFLSSTALTMVTS